MNQKLSRRSFMTTTLSGVGTLALGRSGIAFSQVENQPGKSQKIMSKRLWATTDYSDNVLINLRGDRYGVPVDRTADYYAENRCFLTEKQLDELHQYLASMGVSRHQWILDTMWSLYDDYPHGFDLLKTAAASAHKFGLEFFAELKPWEGGGFSSVLPGTMPCPSGCGAYRNLRGVFPNMRRFEAQNTEFSLKRKVGTFECSKSTTTIRLVKSDDRPTRIKPEHLTIYTSATNNHFEPYKGSVSFRETVEKRFRFPYWKHCRVLHLENLKIPEGHRYFLVRCSFADGKGDFTNEKGNIIELADIKGNQLPHTLSTGPVRLEDHAEFYSSRLNRKVIPYLKTAEVLLEISDPHKMQEHYRDYYAFGDYNTTDPVTLDQIGFVAVACGKPEYIPGQLHPIYPEVRKYWLDMVRFCLDRGVDGINIRTANHTNSPEPWEYGFNKPVLAKTNGDTGYAAVCKVNGNSYTQFLREVRDLVKKRGKSLTIHLETELIIPDDRGKLSSLPFNFEWQWETWVKEIADELEIRGTYGFRPWNFAKAMDVYSRVAKAANKPLFLQGDFHGMSYDGPFDCTEEELKLVQSDKLDGYVFYETANITRINEENSMEGSSILAEMLRTYFQKKE